MPRKVSHRRAAVSPWDFKQSCLASARRAKTATVKRTIRRPWPLSSLRSWSFSLVPLDEVWAIAADTDGIDGSEDNAVSPDTLSRAKAKALDAKALLAKHD